MNVRSDGMSYATAAKTDLGAIPVIDVTDLHSGEEDGLKRVAEEIVRACETVGFFYVRNHGIRLETSQAAWGVAHDFFRRPLEEKQTLRVNDWHRGFISTGQAKMSDGAAADLKESFVWGREPDRSELEAAGSPRLAGPNQWPGFLPQMQPALSAYFTAAHELGWALFRAFAVALGCPPETFLGAIDRPVSRASVIYYPPQPEAMGSGQFGVAPHTDYGCLTLLNQDGVGGLQVRDRSGDWVTAPPVADTLVVNVGDLMARWTNDRFVSTEHRVVNSSGRERFSIAVFVDPNFETPIEPVVEPDEAPRYEPTTCGDHIVGRLNRAFQYRTQESR